MWAHAGLRLGRAYLLSHCEVVITLDMSSGDINLITGGRTAIRILFKQVCFAGFCEPATLLQMGQSGRILQKGVVVVLH